MRILVIDDHAMFAESIKILLGTNHEISTAVTGSEAIAKISEQAPSVILLDNDLPDIDGLTLLKVIQALPEPPPVLMITGSDSMSLVRDARRAGAVGFLHKSLPAESLIDAVDQVANGASIWPDAQDASSHEKDSRGAPVAGMPTLDVGRFNRQVMDQLGITDRQLDVLRLMAVGDPNKIIASKLGIAESTVKTHVKSLFQQLKVTNRVACHNKAMELGLL